MGFKTQIVDLRDPNSPSQLYRQCLELRRDVFMAQLGWNLYESLGCEFDEYDTPASIHVVATCLEGNNVLGCMRLLRTDNQLGPITYMILDAHRGQIPNLPSNIMRYEIQSPSAWEASRLAISGRVAPVDRNSLLVGLVNAGNEYVASVGGDTVLGMMNPVFIRVFRRAGMAVDQFGPIANQRDGKLCILKHSIAFNRQLALAS